MYTHGEMIRNEIQLAEDEGCIVFDFSCYFPYLNTEILHFDFSLGEEQIKDYKLNHRYPNKGYQTISRTYGRRVSKIGYPYVVKLEQTHFLLRINVGLKDQYISLVFPVELNLTKEKPVCGLSLNYNFDKNTFYLMSHEKAEDDGWYFYRWYSHMPEHEITDRDVVLPAPLAMDDSMVAMYQICITPFPSAISDLMV